MQTREGANDNSGKPGTNGYRLRLGIFNPGFLAGGGRGFRARAGGIGQSGKGGEPYEQMSAVGNTAYGKLWHPGRLWGLQSWEAHGQQPTPLKARRPGLPLCTLGPQTLVSASPSPGLTERASADPALRSQAPKFPRNTSRLGGGHPGCPQTQNPGRRGLPTPRRPGEPAAASAPGSRARPGRPGRSRPCGAAKEERAQRPQVCSGTSLASMTFQGKGGGG